MQVALSQKIKIHTFVLPRHFALPFFGGSALIGSLLASGTLSELNTWLGFIAVWLLMASCHAANTFWDWHVGLDAPEGGSVEKGYTGGCGVIANGHCSVKEVNLNVAGFAIAGLVVCGVIAFRVTPYILIPAILGLAVPYFYTRGKFSWYHELALAAGVVLAGIVGMFAVNPHPDWWIGLIVTLPIAIVLSYLGLALDEYPDAYANLKKGTKSIAFKVWENKFDLGTYILAWLTIVYAFQVFLVTIGLLAPLTMLSLLVFPFMIAQLVFLKPHADALRENPEDTNALKGFTDSAMLVVAIAMAFPILVLIGQAVGARIE